MRDTSLFVQKVKDLIPTGNALRASAAHSSGRISSMEFCIRDDVMAVICTL